MARRRLSPAQSSTPSAQAPSPSAPRGPLGAPPIAQMAGQSATEAALRDLAHGIEEARLSGRMLTDVPLEDIHPDHLLRDRLYVDREALDALKTSIRARGQQVPAELMPLDPGINGPRYGLIAGWRRLQALQELHAETGDPAFATLRALIRTPDASADAYVAMVEENEIRAGLSYYERARLVAETVASGVFDSQSAALRTLFANASRAKRSKIASFVEIHRQLGDVLKFPVHISERLGLAVAGQLRDGDPEQVRDAVRAAQPDTAAAELAVLTAVVRANGSKTTRTSVANAGGAKTTQVAKAAPEVLCDGLILTTARQADSVTLTLSGPAVDDALVAAVVATLRDLKLSGKSLKHQ